MSMTGRFLLLTDDEIAGLLRAPETVPDLLDARVYDVDEPLDYVDIDKTWHVLHFLLTGEAWEAEPPLDFIATGGQQVGEEDVGYGPARVLRSPEVRRLAEALAPITWPILLSRFDIAAMDALEIYPTGWSAYDPSGEDGYFSGAFVALSALVKRGAEEGLGLLVWLA